MRNSLDILLKLNHYTNCTRKYEEAKRFCSRKYWGGINCKEYTFLHIGAPDLGDCIWKHLEINEKSPTVFYRNYDRGWKARGLFVGNDLSAVASPLYDRNMIIETGENARERVEEAMRKLLEEISSCGGFFISHVLGGYLGSILTGQILEDLRIFSAAPRLCFSILPAKNNKYVLPGIKYLTQESSANILFSNESLMNLVNTSDLNYINTLIARSVESITHPMRHEGVLNNSIFDLTIHEIPYHTINMLSCSFSPINVDNNSNVTMLAMNAYENPFVPYKCEDGKFISTSLYFRGDVVPKDVMSAIGYLKTRRSIQFTSGFFGGMRCGSVYAPSQYLDGEGKVETAKRSVTVLSNHTGYAKVLEKIVDEHENKEDVELIEFGRSTVKDYNSCEDDEQ